MDGELPLFHNARAASVNGNWKSAGHYSSVKRQLKKEEQQLSEFKFGRALFSCHPLPELLMSCCVPELEGAHTGLDQNMLQRMSVNRLSLGMTTSKTLSCVS